MSLANPRRLFVRGALRAELLAITWEVFSAVLFGSTVLPSVASSPWPTITFAGSLVLSAALLPWLLKRGRTGLTVAGAMRVVAWPLSLLTETNDIRVLVATAAFGAMAWALRRAIYRRELWRFDPVKDGASGALVRARLAESAMVTGIIGGHVLVLFSVAFLHADSKMLFQGWWTFVPAIGFAATAAFTIVSRGLSRPLIEALAAGPTGDPEKMRIAIDAAHKLPLRLSLLNFGIWVACTTVGVFYFRTSPDRFEVTDAVMQVAYAALFSWGVSFSQRGWDRETLAPVERLLASWLPADARAPAADGARSVPLRSRMFRDFGGPLVFTAALSLLSSIGLYRTINRAVSVREDLNAILALSAAFVMLVIAVGAVILRVARNLSRPLSIVAGTAETVAAGRLEARVEEVTGPEEVVGLARSVERMRETLARTIAELEHERATLEANVKTRTAELTRALEELRDAQAALVQGERLASIGELVAGVAHEIYNPLNAVAGSTEPLERVAVDVRAMLDAYRSVESHLPKEPRERIEKLRRELDIDASLDDLVGISSLVKRATNRTVRIVQNLKNFSRRPVEAQPADLHAALDETLLLLGARLRQSCIHVATDFARDTLPEVTCRVGEINQVFMNLLMNSIQALETVPDPKGSADGGPGDDVREIRISTRLDPAAEGPRSSSTARAWAVIAFADNGPGVPEDIEAKIFTPFFTTKPAGQGTGLGLSISSDIIRKHGGTLTLERRREGKGARLLVRLPL